MENANTDPRMKASTMVNPVLTTKVNMPARRTGLVDRPRLMDLMGPGFSATRRLTVVIAPAGFGKTTLVREWCAAREDEADVAWLSLDGGEDDPARFLTYLVMAIRAVYADFGDGILTLLRSPQAPSQETLLTLLINDLSRLSRPLRVVLDDYHLISESAVHHAVAFLLDHLPSLTLHLVIATRVDPPLPLSRLRVRGEMTELRAADLRCHGEEAAAFLQSVIGLALDPEEVAALEERTEGWMAGLQLAGLSLRHRSDPRTFIQAFTGSNRYIVDYLGEEVLRQQSERLQTFLYRTSILERLCGPLCDAVLGDALPGEGQATLEQMDVANLFLVALDEERNWYRYHHLFGDMLKARLLQESASDLPELHRRAARWYEGEGMLGEAVSHALAARDFPYAADLMELAMGDLWRRGEAQTQAGWLNTLPEEILRSRPVLLLHVARAAVVSADATRILKHVECAERVMAERGITEGHLRGQALALRGYAARLLGDDEQALACAEEALPHLTEDRGVWQAVVKTLLAGIYGQQGDLRHADTLLAESASLCEAVGEPQVALIARSLQAHLCQERGNLNTAVALCEQGLAFAARMGAGDLLPMAGFAYVGLGHIAYLRNDLDAAERYCQLGLERGGMVDSADTLLRGNKILGMIHLAHGEVAEARACFERLEAFARTRNSPPLQEVVEAICVRFRMDTGDLVAAEQWAVVAEARLCAADTAEASKANLGRPIIGGPSVFLRDMVRLTLARLRYQQKRFVEAEAQIEVVADLARLQGRNGVLLECQLLTALCREGAGERVAALDALTEALHWGEPEGYLRPFIEAGVALIPLLRQIMMGHAVEGRAYTASILAALQESHESVEGTSSSTAPLKKATAATLVDPLTEREIEVLHLVASGLSNQEIADKLFLSVGTVKRHVHNIYGKLDAANRLDAVTRGREAGLLP